MASGWRSPLGGAVAAAALATALACAPVHGGWTTVPAAVAVGAACWVLVGAHRSRRWVLACAGLAGVGSLVATAGVLVSGHTYADDESASTVWALAEVAGLGALALCAARLRPGRLELAATAVTAVAIPAWLLRYGWGPVTVASLGGYAMWTLVALTAVAIGWYLRALEEREARAVARARRDQRLGLARDLHDFVAHDVSGMVAQAQAGQLLAGELPDTATVFRRIERAGTRALDSMDRAVRLLQSDLDEGGWFLTAAPTLATIAEAVERFGESSSARVELHIDADLEQGDAYGAPPRELVATAHRVVVEALTNVRRHAPAAEQVLVSVTRGPAAAACLDVSITDDGTPGPPCPGRRSGTGLRALADRVEALGGTLTAGPDARGTWRVHAVLPFDGDSSARW